MFNGKNVTHWLGYVEDTVDPLHCGRIKVRVIGGYDKTAEELTKDDITGRGILEEDLPWAMTIMPLDAYNSEVVPPQVPDGAIVYGICIDDDWMQKMICLGILVTKNILSGLSLNENNASTSALTGGNGSAPGAAKMGGTVNSSGTLDISKVNDSIKNMSNRQMQCGTLQDLYKAQIIPESSGNYEDVNPAGSAAGLIQTTNANMIENILKASFKSEDGAVVYKALISQIASVMKNGKTDAEITQALNNLKKAKLDKLDDDNAKNGYIDVNRYINVIKQRLGTKNTENEIAVFKALSDCRTSSFDSSYTLGYACYISENEDMTRYASKYGASILSQNSLIQAEWHHNPATAKSVIRDMATQIKEGKMSLEDIFSEQNFTELAKSSGLTTIANSSKYMRDLRNAGVLCTKDLSSNAAQSASANVNKK